MGEDEGVSLFLRLLGMCWPTHTLVSVALVEAACSAKSIESVGGSTHSINQSINPLTINVRRRHRQSGRNNAPT